MMRPKEATMPQKTLTPLQGLLWPEYGISTERDLYVRLSGPASLSMGEQSLTFAADGAAAFDTSANMFNLGKWRRHCGLTDLHLRLEGTGTFGLEVFQAPPERSWERLFTETITLTDAAPLDLDLSPRMLPELQGSVIFFLRALDMGKLTNAIWMTADAPRRLPDLALSITTFKREEAVRASVARFERFMQTTPLAKHLHLIVVDNGKSAQITSTDHVTAIENENLGGSGGFSRGLLAAEERGASHCLFMDDDASIQMGAIERTWAFLAYAKDPKTAIAGGMTMANHRWAMWESGATFHRHCRPQWLGTDLRDLGQSLAMEHGSTGTKPHNFYGGWWYFAFPIAEVTYRPFPFFVRGDDVSFSIANRFNIVTLPGVVCFQDADFSDKETLQTIYLDLRSHLAHHLALPSMEIGRRGVIRLIAQFFARSMMQCHYETLQALHLAVRDVLEGPAFFARNADMAERRARIAKMRKAEAWAPLQGDPAASRRRFDPRKNRFARAVMKYSLNGHLLPFFGYWGNRVTLKSGQRGQLNEVWGAARITYLNAEGTQTFTVRHSKLAALKEGVAMTMTLARVALRYGALRDDWRRGYAELASDGFWRQKLGLEAQARPGQADAPPAQPVPAQPAPGQIAPAPIVPVVS